MTDMNQIHKFAVKWIEKFKNQETNYIELINHYMADDFDSLGFEIMSTTIPPALDDGC